MAGPLVDVVPSSNEGFGIAKQTHQMSAEDRYVTRMLVPHKAITHTGRSQILSHEIRGAGGAINCHECSELHLAPANRGALTAPD